MAEEIPDEQQIPQLPSKRKPDLGTAAEEASTVESKKLKPVDNPHLPATDGGVQLNPQKEEDGGNAKGGDIRSNGKSPTDRGKGVITAVDKGKGKMVVEDGEEGDGDDDSDDSDEDDSDDDGGDIAVGEADYDSDFVDDPLAEVDLSNILPSRTRRRGPPPPGAYLVNDLDDDEDEDEDEDACD